MISAGIPAIFVMRQGGYTGTELQDAINSDAAALNKFETIRRLWCGTHGVLIKGRSV